MNRRTNRIETSRGKAAALLAALIGLAACSDAGAAPPRNDVAAHEALQLALPQAVTPSVPVRVVNTASDPVPVVSQGTTTIAGNVSVQAMPALALAPNQSIGVTSLPAVQLAPNQFVGVVSMPSVALTAGNTVGIDPASNAVTLTGTPAVTLAGSPTVTIANQPGAGQRYAESATTARTTPVPTGKRLILTLVSLRLDLPAGHTSVVSVNVSNTAGTNPNVQLYVPMTPATSGNGLDSYVGTQQVDLILDAGGSVECLAALPGGGFVGVVCSFFGRLIDA